MKHLVLASLFIFNIASHPSINLTQHLSVTKVVYTDTTLQGKWKLMPVLASDTAAGKIPYIEFDLKTNRFSGNTGCNSMGGNFVLKQDALAFSKNIMSTKMACPGYNENIFLDNLLRTNRYQIQNGVLQLMYNRTILSKWVRHLDTTSIKQI